MDRGALILFSRIPVPGRVKTRLMPPLSGAECAALQKAMTLDTAHTLAAMGRDLFLFHSDEGAPALLDGLPRAARLFTQSGADLGERMYNAVAAVLAMGYGDCLLLGSDLPFLTAPDVAEAGRVLEGSDVVLCPSPDGGYWLIGMHRPFPPSSMGSATAPAACWTTRWPAVPPTACAPGWGRCGGIWTRRRIWRGSWRT